MPRWIFESFQAMAAKGGDASGERVELIGSMISTIEFRGSKLRWIPQWEGPWENDDRRRTRQSQGDIRKNGKKKRIWSLGGGLAISRDGSPKIHSSLAATTVLEDRRPAGVHPGRHHSGCAWVGALVPFRLPGLAGLEGGRRKAEGLMVPKLSRPTPPCLPPLSLSRPRSKSGDLLRCFCASRYQRQAVQRRDSKRGGVRLWNRGARAASRTVGSSWGKVTRERDRSG